MYYNYICKNNYIIKRNTRRLIYILLLLYIICVGIFNKYIYIENTFYCTNNNKIKTLLKIIYTYNLFNYF